ncbi:MAG: Hpt domain-containing protein, partial [Gallionella sp.]|nr:Hpt domain-containing protein [Gallionella sp.]
MDVNPNQFIQTFIAEARERLQEMEDILLHLESGSHDAETIDALFRAAHTIKGSAGMFNFEPIVNFAHIVEDVLERLRDGEIEIEPDLVAVLLDSGDHMQHLVNVLVEQGEQLDDAAQARESELRKRLQSYQAEAHANESGSKGGASKGDEPQEGVSRNNGQQESQVTLAAEKDIPLTSSGGGEVSSDNWHIS